MRQVGISEASGGMQSVASSWHSSLTGESPLEMREANGKALPNEILFNPQQDPAEVADHGRTSARTVEVSQGLSTSAR